MKKMNAPYLDGELKLMNRPHCVYVQILDRLDGVVEVDFPGVMEDMCQ